MKLILEGTPKEIAEAVLAIQAPHAGECDITEVIKAFEIQIKDSTR